MNIRTQFILTILLFGLLLVAISASAIITNYQVERVSEQDKIVHRIAEGAGELSYLAHDYVIYRESQQLERWRARFERFSADVAGLQARGPEQQALIHNMQANARRLGEVFDSVVSAVGRSAEDEVGTISLPMLQISWSRMAVQSQGLVSDASRLSQQLTGQVDRWQRTNAYVMIALIGVFLAYFVVNYWLIQRRMLVSIAELQAGTAVIGSGSLDFRIKVRSDDEIGDLSRAFNRMAADLQVAAEELLVERRRLYELNETLEQHVVARTAELRDSEKKLEAVFDAIVNGVVVFDAAGAPVRANPAAVALLGGDPVGRNRTELIHMLRLRHPDGRPVGLDEMASSRALGGERVVAQPFVLTHPDGKETFILTSGTPLLDGERVSGAVVVWHDITERQALEEARRVQARERAVSDERQRMARDLHDAVSQTLFSASLTADVLPKLYERDANHGQRLLEDLRRMNRGALAEMRALLAELRPQALLDADLAVLLRQLAEAAASRSLVAVSVEAGQVGPLPAEVQVALYRIAQEALHNVVKHARACQAAVRLERSPGAGRPLRLVVEDDGCGFDPGVLPADTFGLSIMSERARAIGASLAVDSRPGGGTRVRVDWPGAGDQPAAT